MTDPTLPGIPNDAIAHAENVERARALVDHRPRCVAAHADRVCNCDYDRRRDAIASALTTAETRGFAAGMASVGVGSDTTQSS